MSDFSISEKTSFFLFKERQTVSKAHYVPKVHGITEFSGHAVLNCVQHAMFNSATEHNARGFPGEKVLLRIKMLSLEIYFH